MAVLIRVLLAAVFLYPLLNALAVAEEEEPAPILFDPRLGPDDDAYMNRQAEALLKDVDRALEHNPPQAPDPEQRRLALHLLDAVLHDPYAPSRPPVREFYHRRIERAVEEIESTPVRNGARIWKLYNHGFVVKTPTVTVGFDLHRGTRGFRYNGPGKKKSLVRTPAFPISKELAQRLADQVDVMFISHRHGDHADEFIAKAILDAGKPVVSPPNLWREKPLHDRLTYLERQAHVIQTLPIQNGSRELEVVVYPGQQYQGTSLANNVVIVYTPEGITIAHNGDQINDPYPEYQEDFKWIDKVKEHHKVDVLFTNCWTNDILRMVRGFDPQVVIPGHENELGHPIWDRVPYWGDENYLKMNYSQVKREYPVIPMVWGESYSISRHRK